MIRTTNQTAALTLEAAPDSVGSTQSTDTMAKKVKAPVAVKPASSSDSSSGSSSDEAPQKVVVAKKGSKAAPKKPVDSDSSDSDSSSDEEEAPKKVVAKKPAAKKEESSSSDSSSDEEEAPKKKATPTKKVVAKKAESSSDSSDSSSDEEEAPKKATPAKKVAAKKDSDSSSDSDSSDDEAAKKPVAKKTATKKEKSSSSSSSDSDSSSDEEETPIVSKKRKNSDAGEKSSKVHKQENGDAAAVANPQKNLEIFIAGLPWSATEEEVKEHFAGCGEVTAARIPLQNGRSSGTAFVTFATPEAAEAALAMDGQDFGGRWMKIRTAEKKNMFDEKPEGCTSVFIGNLSWDVDENTIRETFGECGEILSCRLATDRETGEFRGFGHVDFASTEAVDEAVKLAGS
ncbi:hypothetical protein PI124_g15110, partial [Phytophthora idaei]